MKIIEVARMQKDLLNEGIAYIAVWQETLKNGQRSWKTEDIFPDSGVENDEPIFSEEQQARLLEIATLDENAVLLNGWIHSWIGSIEEPLTATQIAEGIKKHYEQHNSLVSGYLAEKKPCEHSSKEQPSKPHSEKTRGPRQDNCLVGERTSSEMSELTNSCVNERYGTCEDVLTVAMPREYFIADSLENLKKLVQSKASLIKKALGVDNLPIEIDEEKVSFPWFSPQGDAALVRAYTHFVYALCEMARNQKRVNSSEKEVENEKYAFRCFLLRLGFIGAEYKGERKILLRNFTGSSAYKTKEVSDENTK